MKIGILTFHCAHNYGAVLQAYALQETIKELGHEVEIINYRPSYLIEKYKPFSKKLIFSGKFKNILKKLIHAILFYPYSLKRWKLFNNFINTHLNISTEPLVDTSYRYNLYIFGSDQIWNSNITKGHDKVYWGFFKTNNSSKKITYSASFGDAKNIHNETLFLEKALMNFDDISLRENNYLELIQSIRKKKIQSVLDPTLIIDDTIWNNVAVKPNIKSKYVLVYQVRSSPETNRIALEIAKQIQGIVIEIPAKISYKNFYRKYNSVSPFEFLGWIKYATCIVTTSFHGTAFSTVFKKDFYTVNLNDGSEKRSKDLLNSINLSDRLIHKESSINFKKIDYTDSIKSINKLKQGSFEYLKKHIN